MIRSKQAGKKKSGGFSLEVFTDDELYDIHLATLEVLEKTGVFVEDLEAIEIFNGGGAVVEPKRQVVKIPPYVVEDTIRSVSSKLIVAGRNPDRDVVLEAGRVNFANFGEGLNVIDPYTGEIRSSTKADLGDTARLVDYLSDTDVYEHALAAHDVPQEVLNIHDAETLLTNTTKHAFLCAGSGRQAKRIIEIAEAVVGGNDKLRERPIITLNVCPISPLKLTKESTQVIIEAARSGVQTMVISMALAGASAPVTLAGTLVIHNAEVLSGLVLSQLTCKGTPVFYGSSTTAMDMKCGTSAVGCPELGMISAGVAQLARYYLLPSWVAGG